MTHICKGTKSCCLNSLCCMYMFRPVDRDVFVHDLNSQLGTPSRWLPVNSCKKEDKEAP